VQSTGVQCKRKAMRKEDGSGYYPTCHMHGAKGGKYGRRKPGDAKQRLWMYRQQSTLRRKQREQELRAKTCDRMNVDPVQPQSPLEERFASGPRKPLRPLY
jgi:hypothetical protein